MDVEWVNEDAAKQRWKQSPSRPQQLVIIAEIPKLYDDLKDAPRLVTDEDSGSDLRSYLWYSSRRYNHSFLSKCSANPVNETFAHLVITTSWSNAGESGDWTILLKLGGAALVDSTNATNTYRLLDHPLASMASSA